MNLNPQKKVYIAGPMTGYPQFNFSTFDTFRDLYKKFGFEVFSPADHDRMLLGKPMNWMPTEADHTGDWKAWAPSVTPLVPTLREMLGADLQWIAKEATHICMIPMWEKSSGANAEWSLAKALGLTIHYYPMPHDMIREVIKEKDRLN